MRKHTKVYLSALGYDLSDPNQFIQSEISGLRAVDIHHIDSREDRIENLMAVTREEHQKLGEIKSKMCFLLDIHREFLIMQGVEFDNNWFKERIEKYEVYNYD